MPNVLGRAVAAAVVLAAGAAACATSPPVIEDRVLVVGDSLVNGSASTISEGLRNGGWEPVVDGRPGWSIGRWTKALPPVVEDVRPRVAIVVLGTNDCAPDCVDVSQGITRIVQTLTDAGVERVFWFNVQVGAGYPAHPERVNAWLDLAASQWPRLTIVDMRGTLGGRPELHTTDGVHFNEAGGLELTKLMVDAASTAR